jgi:hypothetical protein
MKISHIIRKINKFNKNKNNVDIKKRGITNEIIMITKIFSLLLILSIY